MGVLNEKRCKVRDIIEINYELKSSEEICL